MEFFKPLEALLGGKFEQLTLTIKPVGNEYAVAFLPTVDGKDTGAKLIPLNITGTAQELDEGFLGAAKEYAVSVTGLRSNLEQVKTQAKEIEDEAKKEAQAKKKTDKPKADKGGKAKKKAEKTTSKPEPEDEEKEDELDGEQETNEPAAPKKQEQITLL